MKEQILQLKHLECFVVPESDYGKAEVYRINEFYVLFSIPCYGGPSQLHDYYQSNNIDIMIQEIESWT